MSVRDLQDDVAWINSRWEHLADARLRGTPRPWHQPPTKTRNTETGIRPAFTLSPTPAPLHLDTWDLIAHILRKTRHLAVITAIELDHHQVLAYLQHHHSTDPADELDYVLRHQSRVAEETQAATEHHIRRIRDQMTEHFAETLDGQQLHADCPWCHHPGLRIRLIGPEHHQQPVVICENTNCNPSTSECGQWWHGHPVWPFHEWEWLAQRIAA